MGGQGLALVLHKTKNQIDLGFVKMSSLAMKHRTSFLNIYTTSTINDNEEDEKDYNSNNEGKRNQQWEE
jgi:hypothetical protein